MARKISKRKLVNMSPQEIGSMKKAELREFLRGVRNLYTQQASKFERYKETVYSPAKQKVEAYYDTHDQGALSRMNINEMRGEAFKLQEFFQADTSTVPGARKVMKEQAVRIFGEDSRGRAKYRPTTDQWSAIWNLYSEYKNMRPADVFDNSTKVQQAVGQVIMNAIKQGHDLDISADKLQQVANLIEEQQNRFHWEMSNVDYGEEDLVFSGEWDS